MTVRVELCGRLKEAGLGESVELELAQAPTAGAVIAALSVLLRGRRGLLRGAAVATEEEVLSARDPLPSGGRLAVLPPVCGG